MSSRSSFPVFESSSPDHFAFPPATWPSSRTVPEGSRFTRAAKRVLVTAERLVPTERLAAQPELTLVPGFMVEAAAIVPRGAWPGSMHPDYEIDYPAVETYMKDEPGTLERHLSSAPESRST